MLRIIGIVNIERPWKDRLWGNLWRQRGPSGWPHLWRDDRRVRTWSGEKNHAMAVAVAAAVLVQFGVARERGGGWLLSVPFLSVSVSLFANRVLLWGTLGKIIGHKLLGKLNYTFSFCFFFFRSLVQKILKYFS